MSFHQPHTSAFYDSDNLKLLQRALEGACWAVGIPPRVGSRDTGATLATREMLAKAVIGNAGRGTREVQELKAGALRALGVDRRSGALL